MHHGFDEYFGLPYSNDMWPRHPTAERLLSDLPLIEGDKVVKLDPDQSQAHDVVHGACGRASSSAIEDKPFFLYVPHTMPHVPLFVSDKFKGKSAAGCMAT